MRGVVGCYGMSQSWPFSAPSDLPVVCGRPSNTVVLTGPPDLPPVLAAGGERRSNQNSFSAKGSAH